MHKQGNIRIQSEQTAVRVSAVSLIWNIILTVCKLFAGIFAHSGAMVSDAVHSASDVFISIVMLFGIRIAAHEPDEEHPYGHERFECAAAIVLAAVLLMTGLLIGVNALETICSGDGRMQDVPGIPALITAAASILVKEILFRYTKYYAGKLDSSAIMADAWHHRSDALSSAAALAGIAGAGMGLYILEPAASLIICLLIVKAAVSIFWDAIGKMVDRSCDKATAEAIRECVLSQEGVIQMDALLTRVSGSRLYADIEIQADGAVSLRESHAVAQGIREAVRQHFPIVKRVMVYVNPSEIPDADGSRKDDIIK